MKLLFFTLSFFSILYSIFSAPYSHAQEISPNIKRNVVQNYKANLSGYLTFGSNCDLKPKGDANCDGIINQFDLSIWEIEFNATNNPKRSDFNNDGLINLLDFGIWRNTFFPQKSSNSGGLFEFFSSIFNLQSLITSIYAQQTQANTQPLDSSQAIISGSGNSLVVNSDSNSQTQQVSFNPDGSAVSSQLFDSNGRLLANVSFLSSGTTSITTQEDGITVQINKTAEGAVIEFFRNPDGSLIAIKSWPNLASYEAGDPPLSVTIPGQGNTRNVLNIQPNGDGIYENTSNLGMVTSRTQLRSNGTYVSEDFQNKTIVQSNSQVGFTTLTIPNNLGGNTNYMFFKGELYAIIQTDNKNSYYIAKPLDPDGNSWSFESNINGQKTERIISDPIKELNANTPDPKELIKYINYYKSAGSNADAINFSDGFPASARSLQPQIQRANAILTISQAPAPGVLGIVKEVHAQSSNAPPPPNTPQVPAGYTATYKGVTEFDTHDGYTYQWDLTQNGAYAGNIQAQLPTLTNSGVTDPNPATQSFGQVTLNLNGKETETARVGDLQTLKATIDGSGILDATTVFPSFQQAAPPAAPGAPPVIQPAPPVSQQARDDWARSAAPVAAAPAATVGQTYQMGNAVATVTSVNGSQISVSLSGPGLNGTTTFTQDLSSLTTTFADDRGTFTANAGALTAISTDVSSLGSIVGLNQNGSLVAVGDASLIGPDGLINDAGGARQATLEERAAFEAQQTEQAAFTGTAQITPGPPGLAEITEAETTQPGFEDSGTPTDAGSQTVESQDTGGGTEGTDF